MNKLIDPIDEKYRKALDKSYNEVERLIEFLLPDKAFEDLYKDLEWIKTRYVKGANTLVYDGEPIISLFPLEIKEDMDDESLSISIRRRYIKHKEEEDEDNN